MMIDRACLLPVGVVVVVGCCPPRYDGCRRLRGNYGAAAPPPAADYGMPRHHVTMTRGYSYVW